MLRADASTIRAAKREVSDADVSGIMDDAADTLRQAKRLKHIEQQLLEVDEELLQAEIVQVKQESAQIDMLDVKQEQSDGPTDRDVSERMRKRKENADFVKQLQRM